MPKKPSRKTIVKKLDNVFEESLTKWLDKNAPEYLNKYLKNRSI